MTEQTSRLALPLLQAGQAQKELFHNEALALLDLAVQATVIGINVQIPPTEPRVGQCWIVGNSPQGDWAGHANHIAGWTTGGWRFVPPIEGMYAWCTTDTLWVQHIGDTWVAGQLAAREVRIGGQKIIGPRQSGIDQPSGGATVDTEARTAISEVLTALRNHGLIAA